MDSIQTSAIYTITTSIAINCDEHPITLQESTLTIATTSPTDVVKIRGLSMNGFRRTGGFYSLNFTGSGLLVIERANILSTAGTAGGFAIRPSGPARVVMSDSTIADNGSGGNILIRPTGGNAVQVILNRVTTAGSVFGVKADGSGQSSGIIDVEARDSVSSNNANNGYIAVSGAGQAQIRFKITNSSSDGNGVYGAVATGAQAFMIIDRANFSGNGTGLAQLDGATIGSPGTSIVNFNTTNVVGTITPITLR